MVRHLSTKKMQEDLRKAFEHWDQNGDGFIHKKEFIDVYKSLNMGRDSAEIEKEASKVFDKANIDGSGVIDFGEWCDATINKNELLNEKNLRYAFTQFDVDGSGTIGAAEVGFILGHNIAKEEHLWKEVIKEVDINGDG